MHGCKEDTAEHLTVQKPAVKLVDKICLVFLLLFFFLIHCELDFHIVSGDPEYSSHFKAHAKRTSKLEG